MSLFHKTACALGCISGMYNYHVLSGDWAFWVFTGATTLGMLMIGFHYHLKRWVEAGDHNENID